MDTFEFSYTKNFQGRNVPSRLRIAHALRALMFLPLLVIEWKSVVGLRKSKSNKAPMLLSDITNSTSGRGLELFHFFVCSLRFVQTKKFDKNALSLKTPAGTRLKKDQIDHLVSQLKLKGATHISEFLSPSQVSEILESIGRLPGKGSESPDLFKCQEAWMQDPSGGPRFELSQNELQALSSLQEISNNDVLLKIARDYLSCAPLLSSIQIWTTRQPRSKSLRSLENSAMAFHCDSDYFGFIKFFILLNKVDMNNGPFTFVEKSHRGKRHVAGRMEDNNVVNYSDALFYGTGNAGDLILADTKGWHKAMPPTSGYRTMLQLVFTSSYFGRVPDELNLLNESAK